MLKIEKNKGIRILETLILELRLLDFLIDLSLKETINGINAIGKDSKITPKYPTHKSFIEYVLDAFLLP